MPDYITDENMPSEETGKSSEETEENRKQIVKVKKNQGKSKNDIKLNTKMEEE